MTRFLGWFFFFAISMVIISAVTLIALPPGNAEVARCGSSCTATVAAVSEDKTIQVSAEHFVATWEAATPPPCPEGDTIEDQTATWTSYTATPVPFPTCDLSRP